MHYFNVLHPQLYGEIMIFKLLFQIVSLSGRKRERERVMKMLVKNEIRFYYGRGRRLWECLQFSMMQKKA